MRLKSFLEGYPKALFSNEGDEIFSTFRLLMNGMCSHRMAKFLNYASLFLNKDEFYMEIGTYAGFSLMSAAYERAGRFVGIDNFSENFSVNGEVKERLRQNFEKYPGNYIIIDSDFRIAELEKIIDPTHKAGVFLIDGKHTYEDVKESIAWGKKYLADEAVIVFDDLNVPGVKKAVDEIKQEKEFSEIFMADSFFDVTQDNGMSTDKYIHNGFSVMTYKKGVANV